MSYTPRQSRPNAIRDLTISVIWVAVCALFLNVDRHRILNLKAAGNDVNLMSWLQIPIWVGLLVFWVRSGLRAWARIRANDSESR